MYCPAYADDDDCIILVPFVIRNIIETHSVGSLEM